MFGVLSALDLSPFSFWGAMASRLQATRGWAPRRQEMAMTRTDIRGLVDTTPTIELPLLIGELEAAKAAAWTRLNAQVDRPQVGAVSDDRLLTPDEAAAIAGVKVTRIYAWARGQRWALRPSRKCLRVSEPAFRRWLRSREA